MASPATDICCRSRCPFLARGPWPTFLCFTTSEGVVGGVLRLAVAPEQKRSWMRRRLFHCPICRRLHASAPQGAPGNPGWQQRSLRDLFGAILESSEPNGRRARLFSSSFQNVTSLWCGRKMKPLPLGFLRVMFDFILSFERMLLDAEAEVCCSALSPRLLRMPASAWRWVEHSRLQKQSQQNPALSGRPHRHFIKIGFLISKVIPTNSFETKDKKSLDYED